MKRLIIVFTLLIIILTTACQKMKSNHQNQILIRTSLIVASATEPGI